MVKPGSSMATVRQVLSGGGAQVITVAVVFLIGALTIPGFATVPSVRAMLVIASFLGIAAIGQTFVILVGSIDLSVPAMIGAGNVITAVLAADGVSSPVILAVVVTVGIIVGVANGVITSVWRLPSLVVTLATGSIVAGSILLWTNANLRGSAPEWLTQFTSPAGTVGPVPIPGVVVLWLALAVVLYLVATRTWTGKRIYAHGVNRRAAGLMLVSDVRITSTCFAISAVLAAITGSLLAGFTGGGLFNVGDPYLFLTIAAVVIGGTSLLGGRGSVGRTVLGSFTLVVLTTLLVGMSLSSQAQQAVLGAVIVLVTAMYGRERRLSDRI